MADFLDAYARRVGADGTESAAKVAVMLPEEDKSIALIKPGQVSYINGTAYYNTVFGYTDTDTGEPDPPKPKIAYVKKSEFDALNISTVPIPANFAGLEAEAIPTRLMDQLFRIVEVVENEDYVEVTARHVWYDNLKNFTTWEPTKDVQYSAGAVCRNVLTNAISPVASDVATDCADTLPGTAFDYKNKNLVECFLDPENGICAKFGLHLIRYDWDFYCLKSVGYNRGFVIENGKNLLGVNRTESIENLATRVAPYGKDKKGNIVWLNHEGQRYIDSQYAGNYSYPMVEIYDTGIQIGKDGTTDANIQEKLLAAGQKRFSEDHIDIPEVEMTIEFLSLGDTEEYAQYRGLDKVYLYDILTIKDTVRGYSYTAQVVGVEHDILTGMLLSVTIGKLNNWDGTRKIATWQVPEVSGENIRLLSIQAGAFAPGAINDDDIATGAIAYLHLASATIDALTSDSITAVTANIRTIIAGQITADAIDTTEISAINATLGTATVENGQINNADINFAKIKDASVQSLIARDAVTDKYYIDKLAVRNAQMVYATVGELVIKANDNKYYRLDIDQYGALTPTEVTLTQSEITTGVTSDGRGSIIETDLTVADLSATNMKGISALIDKLTASRIDVDELFARQAFLGKLNTTDISSNTYLQLYVSNNAYEKQSGIVINGNGIEVSGSKYVKIKSGGSFSVDSGNFAIDTSGNVTLTGTISAGAGSTIGGWTIGANRISSGSSSGYVAMDSDTSGTYAIWAGNATASSAPFSVTRAGAIKAQSGSIGGWTVAANRMSSGSSSGYVAIDSDTGNTYAIWAGAETASSAPFRVKRDGTVTLTKLLALGEDGTETEVNLRNASIWKLSYATIKSVSVSNGYCSSITFSNSVSGYTTVNFTNATPPASLTGSWSGTTYTAEDSFGNSISTTLAYQASLPDWQTVTYTSFNSSHLAGVIVREDGGSPIYAFKFDATSVYNAGYGAAHVSKTWGTGNESNKVIFSKSSSGETDTYTLLISAQAAISYNSSAHTYTATGKADCDGGTKDIAYATSGTEAYSDGQTAAGLSINGSSSSSNPNTIVRALSSTTKSVTISATAGISYNPSTHKYTATAQSKAGSTNMGSASAVSGTEAYDAGVTAGTSAGQTAAGLSVNGSPTNTIVRALTATTKSVTISATAGISYNPSTHKYTATAQSKATPAGGSAVNMGSASAASGTEAYDAGYSAGKSDGQAAAGLSINGDPTNTVVRALTSDTKSVSITATADITYNPSTHKYTAAARAKAGSTNMGAASAVSGTEAYDAGYTAGWNAYRAQILSDNGNLTRYYKPGTWRGYLWSAPNDHGVQYSNCASGLTAKTIPDAI